MISSVKVLNGSEVPKEYMITKHHKMCSVKNIFAPMAQDYPLLVANHYEAFYMCQGCLRGQRIWFTNKGGN